MTWKERYPNLLACVCITYLNVYRHKAANKHDLKRKIPRSACLCIHYLSKPPTNMTWKERYPDLLACVYITYLSVCRHKAANKHDLKRKIPRSACLCIHYLSEPPTNVTWKERYPDLLACVYITYLNVYRHDYFGHESEIHQWLHLLCKSGTSSLSMPTSTANIKSLIYANICCRY